MKHVNFQLYRTHPDGVIWKKLTIDNQYINKWVWNETICQKEKIVMTLIRFTPLWNACLISKNVFIRKIGSHFNSTWKKGDFSTSVSEANENVYLFVYRLWLVSFGVCIYVQYLFGVVRNKLQTINTRVNQKKIKSSRKEYIMWTCFNFWPMKNNFRKL